MRGFERISFSLDRGENQYAGWTVFTGRNGSGKSTLLKAIALVLTGTDAARALQPSLRGWLRAGATHASIQAQVVRSKDEDSFVEKGRQGDSRFPAKIELRNGDREPTLEAVVPPGRAKTYRTPQRSIWAQDAAGWFSCGYGPFRRIFGASPDAVRQMTAPTTERFVTMFQEAASLAEVDQWLRNPHHKSLEHRKEESRQLEAVVSLLQDDLLPNGVVVDRVDSDGLWLKDRDGTSLVWGDMSDGYRSAIALLADILRHMLKAQSLDKVVGTQSGKPVILTSGVVLIDEVDAHLHPGMAAADRILVETALPANSVPGDDA